MRVRELSVPTSARPAVETVAAIREAGGEATATGGDVVSSDDAKAMVQAAIDAYGRLDVLLNSAGVSGRVEGATHEDVWDKVMDVNLKGTYLVSWHAAPEMETAGGGSIINSGRSCRWWAIRSAWEAVQSVQRF